ncbi:MAG: ABC transporter permease [Candidatus Eisenbacteria bacterium]
MSFLLGGIGDALDLIARLDRELLTILGTTLRVSLTSTLIASLLSLPAGFLLAIHRFHGKQVVLALLKTAFALPTVVVGLFVYAFIARNAPLGGLGLLFSPAAIVIGQVLLVTPLMTALVHGVLFSSMRTSHEEALLLGASPLAAFWKTLLEARAGIATAVVLGFGRVVSEIGISLVLGGNIRGLTRTMTTAIALETGQGRFPEAVALGIVLLLIVLGINLGVQLVESRSGAL